MIEIIVGSVLLAVLLFASYKLLKPRFLVWQRKYRYYRFINKIDRLFQHHNAFLIAKEASEGLNDSSYIYGEVTVSTLLDLLAMLSPNVNDVFYDLGSGIGKTLLVVKWRYPEVNVKGIEKLAALHAVAEQIAQKQTSHPITPICADFLEWDFTDATIVFINATAFSVPLWNALLEKLWMLKPQTKIIVTSKTLPENGFIERYAGMEQMSWGLCSTYIYEKR